MMHRFFWALSALLAAWHCEATQVLDGTMDKTASTVTDHEVRLDFEPSAYNSLALYLAGDNIGYVGSQPYWWMDQSNNSNNARRVSGSPKVVMSSGNKGGQFKAMSIRPGDGLHLGDRTYFGDSHTIVVLSRYTQGNRGRLVESRTTNWLIGHHGGGQGGYANPWVTDREYAAPNQYFLTTMRTNSRTTSLFRNNVLSGTAYTYHVPGYLGVGRGGMYGGWESTNGEIALVMGWTRGLSDDELSDVFAEINDKYKIWDPAPAEVGPAGRQGNYIDINTLKSMIKHNTENAIKAQSCWPRPCSMTPADNVMNGGVAGDENGVNAHKPDEPKKDADGKPVAGGGWIV